MDVYIFCIKTIFITYSLMLISSLYLVHKTRVRSLLLSFATIYALVLGLRELSLYSVKAVLRRDIFLIDFFQFWLTLISLIIIIVAVHRSYEGLVTYNYRILGGILLINTFLILILIGTYKVFHFFIIFELSIVPIFIIILGWGYQPEKIKAAYALFFFTAVTASPLLMIAIYFYSQRLILVNFFWEDARNIRFYGRVQCIIFLSGFMVKLPIYGAHLWLPLAHVEAPVYGSIILAGILLKLGGLGILRLSCFLSNLKIINFFVFIRFLGIVFVRATCLFLTDLKKIIAFSSVSHIAFSIIFLRIKIKSRLTVATIVLLVHAFSSSGIFFIVYIFYLRTNSRNLLLNIGLASIHPIIRFFWLIIIIARLGAPPAINLLAEMWCVILSFILLFKYALILVISFIITRVYHFILYSTITQGTTLWDRRKHFSESSHVGVYLISFYHMSFRILRVLLIRFFLK